jgi:hypothetical protein
VAEEAREDVGKQPADIGGETPVVTEEHTQDFRDCPEEPSVGQGQQQVVAEVLAEQEVRFWAHPVQDLSLVDTN